MIVGPLTWNPSTGAPGKGGKNDFEGELGSSESFSTILGLSSIILLFILMDTPRSGHHCRPCHTLTIIGTRLVLLLVAPLRGEHCGVFSQKRTSPRLKPTQSRSVTERSPRMHECSQWDSAGPGRAGSY